MLQYLPQTAVHRRSNHGQIIAFFLRDLAIRLQLGREPMHTYDSATYKMRQASLQ